MPILQQIQRLCQPSIAETRKSRPPASGAQNVNLTWILLGALCWGLAFAFVLVLMQMSRDQDRAARREQRRFDPLADATITRTEDRTSS